MFRGRPERQAADCARTLPVELILRGKVREVYSDGPDVILVASDRVSVYDVVLPTPIPDKGAILTQLSLWWFGQMADLVPNHVLSQDVPPEWKGRAIRCRRLDMVPVECIARGYLTGLGLESYRASGSISGVQLPPGLVEADRLPDRSSRRLPKQRWGMTNSSPWMTYGMRSATRLQMILNG